jgi:hypothetical protein
MVNIDKVYQRILAIANKEQRGYITPQEFNIFANQAQMDIFEQYFYDLNAFSRIPGNDTTYADMLDLLNEKIDIFERFRQVVAIAAGAVGTLPAHYRMGELSLDNAGDGTYVEIEKINQNELNHIINAPLIAPTVSRPIYIHTGENAIQVYPITIAPNVTCNYIARPATVRWGYTIVNDQALYNSSATYTTHFELHASEETDLVIKILAISGITIKDPQLYPIATAEDTKNEQQEKQ